MHENHRQRMRERFLKSDPDTFYEHELLEMLLYSAIPRGDTNEYAHLLLERFGSLRGVFEASPESLQEVRGIGPSAAVSIKLVLEMMKRYAKDLNAPVVCYDKISKIVSFLHPRFLGATSEQVHLLLFNNRMEMLDASVVSVGSVNSADVPIQDIATKALYTKASHAILAHNHPHGWALPSAEDKHVTERVRVAFDLFKVNLLEHLVFSDDGYYPIMKQEYGVFRSATPLGQLCSDFYHDFYDIDEESFRFPPLFSN
ncbi:MAG: RadC family protein [Clostridia bacterium]|nr:RadC family protein [Clostridia bacterium]